MAGRKGFIPEGDRGMDGLPSTYDLRLIHSLQRENARLATDLVDLALVAKSFLLLLSGVTQGAAVDKLSAVLERADVVEAVLERERQNDRPK